MPITYDNARVPINHCDGGDMLRIGHVYPPDRGCWLTLPSCPAGRHDPVCLYDQDDSPASHDPPWAADSPGRRTRAEAYII